MAGCKDRGREPYQGKGQPLEAGQGKETGFPLEAPERNRVLSTP